MDSPPRRQGIVVAVLLGLTGAIGIWVLAPYNNLIIRNANITDSYLPGIVLLVTLVFVLAVNPLLRVCRLAPLTTRQLALAVGLMLVACVVPTNGATRGLIYSLARAPQQIRNDKTLARQYESMHLPQSMFPESTRKGEQSDVGDRYLNGLQPGEELPWHAWVGPILTWGAFLGFAWMMMIGLSMVVFPQWRNNERLAFPLLAVQQSLIETPEPGQALPPLLRTRSFWIAAIGVLIVYTLFGLHEYSPEKIPVIPLKWDFSSLFAKEPWDQMPGYIREGRVYFLLIGMAFFMPTRISLSIWFFLIAYGVYRGMAPVFGWDTMVIPKTDDQRYGAVIMLTICVLYIGRAQWARVFRSMFRRPDSAIDRRNRVSGWVFTIGLVGMFAWLMWVGAGYIWHAPDRLAALGRHAGWSVVLVAFTFMIALLIARIVAETGMPFVRLYEQPMVLMQMVPVAWVGAVSLLMAMIMDLLFSLGSRVSPSAASLQAIGLDESGPPQRQSRIGVALVGVVVLGIAITWASNLAISYNHSSDWHGHRVHGESEDYIAKGNGQLKELYRRAGDSEPLDSMPYNRPLQFGIGAVLAFALYYLCLTVPRWPLHPFGLMLVDSHYGHAAWASIFIGWLLQIVIVKYGGARLYRRARPVFLGLIIGEVLASAVWAAVPVFRHAMGMDYYLVPILPQ